jgi:putative transposase
LFCNYWRRKSQGKPKISPETVALIEKLAGENQLWGAERIRGELLKLGIEVSKRTIQKYMPKERGSRASSQTWATFLKNQAGDIWACDLTVVYDWSFRQWYIFVVLELKRRRIVHASVIQYPTDEWTAQQLREATSWGRGPKYLVRDRDSRYAARFSAVAASSSIQELKTPYRAPRANGICERFIGSLRRECLDHILFHDGKHVQRVAGSIWLTTIRNDLIKGLVSRSPIIMSCQSQSQSAGVSDPKQSLADYITVIPVRLILTDPHRFALEPDEQG